MYCAVVLTDCRQAAEHIPYIYTGACQSFPMLHDQPCWLLHYATPDWRLVDFAVACVRLLTWGPNNPACESGFIPGAVVMTSHFYTSKELAIRLCWFWSTLNVARVCSALLAAGILQMRGIAGRPGWFWLFVSRPLVRDNSGP